MVHVVLVPTVHCCNKVVLNRPCCVFASWLFSAKLVYQNTTKLSLPASQLPAYLFISSKYWRHGKVAHVFVKKSVKLLWKDDPCHVKEQLLISEELDILLSKKCSINNYLLLILCRKGVKPMTF